MMKRDYEIPYMVRAKGDEKMAVIICHGFGSSMKSPTAQMMLSAFYEQNIGALAFDFPAHGDSQAEGKLLTVENCVEDLKKAEEHLREICPDSEIGYFGSSFGAYIILNYLMKCPEKKCKGFLRSAAVNMADVFNEPAEAVEYSEIELTQEFVDNLSRHDLLKVYKATEADLMMIHGTDDEDIDYQVAASFAKDHGIPLITVEKGDHRLSGPGMAEQVKNAAIEFFRG